MAARFNPAVSCNAYIDLAASPNIQLVYVMRANTQYLVELFIQKTFHCIQKASGKLAEPISTGTESANIISQLTRYDGHQG